MSGTIVTTVSICPIYKMGATEVWVKCPSMEMTTKPSGTPAASSYGCHTSGGGTNPNCVNEVREIVFLPSEGLLQSLFPGYVKIPRDTAECPLIQRGQIEELHSSERLFLAQDTKETHLIRLYLLLVTVPGSAQFYWPVGFEVTGYAAGLHLPVVGQCGGVSPEYCVEFSSMTFDILVESNKKT